MSHSKVVVVTGVSSGIGRAAAMKFAKQGCYRAQHGNSASNTWRCTH